MSKEFYTSPELSRELAEAGLPQEGRAFVCAKGDVRLVSHMHAEPCWRALRLDEVLDELETLGCVDGWTLTGPVGCDFSAWGTRGRAEAEALSDDGFGIWDAAESPVEAAGRVLLELLRERKEGKVKATSKKAGKRHNWIPARIGGSVCIRCSTRFAGRDDGPRGGRRYYYTALDGSESKKAPPCEVKP